MKIRFEKELTPGETIELHSHSVPKKGDLLQVGNSVMAITSVHWSIVPGWANADVTLESTDLKDKLNVCPLPRN